MIISKAEIEHYIPQRPPFIMIDNLLEATPDEFETDFRILPDNIFIEKGLLREFGLIENIAQSCSAGLAVTRKLSGNKLADGFIGAISKLKLYELPRINDTILTNVKLLVQLENLFLLKGENFVNGRKLLECEVKLAGV